MAFSTGARSGRRPQWGGRPLTGLDSTGQPCPARVCCRFALPMPATFVLSSASWCPDRFPNRMPGASPHGEIRERTTMPSDTGHRGSREPAADNRSSRRPVKTLLGCPRAPRPRMCPPHGRLRPSVVRSDSRTPGGSRPPRPPDGELRLAARQRALAGPVAAAKEAGRTDVPDRSGLEEIFEGSLHRGLLRLDVALVPRPPVRGDSQDHRVPARSATRPTTRRSSSPRSS